jgi:hypothetical protein
MKLELPGALESLKTTFASIDNRLNIADQSLDEMTALLCNMHQRLSAIENHLQHDGSPAALKLLEKPNGRPNPNSDNFTAHNSSE